MKVEENGYCYCSYRDDSTSQALDTANTVHGSAEVAVTAGVLVSVAAQSLSYDDDIVYLALCVQFITDVTTTSLTGELIDEVRGP